MTRRIVSFTFHLALVAGVLIVAGFVTGLIERSF